jgi:glycosyltransferase involved in cell wall biosynthesis
MSNREVRDGLFGFKEQRCCAMTNYPSDLPTDAAELTINANTKSVENLPNTCIVVPCYNEATRFDGDSFRRCLTLNPHLSFLFVDDGSSDMTLDQLAALQARKPKRIRLLALPQNKGKAEAVRQGLLRAAATDAALLGYWDADLAAPLSAIRDFIQIAYRYPDIQVVYGARMQLLGHQINRSIWRRMVSKICGKLARTALRLPVSDTQCGAKLLRNTPELCSALSTSFTTGWLFDVELFTRLSQIVENRRKAFYEFPLPEWTEVAGSKITPRVIAISGLFMLRLVIESRLRSTKMPPLRRTSSPAAKLSS